MNRFGWVMMHWLLRFSMNTLPMHHPWEFAISWNTNFIGKDVLLRVKDEGIGYFVFPFAMEGRRKAMPDWEVLMGDEVIGTVLSGVISPSLNNTPIGFIGVNRSMEPGTLLNFRQKGSNGGLQGKVAEIPFIPLTSRVKMANFIQD